MSSVLVSLSLSRKSVVRLTDYPDMTIAVWLFVVPGRTATMKEEQQ